MTEQPEATAAKHHGKGPMVTVALVGTLLLGSLGVSTISAMSALASTQPEAAQEAPPTPPTGAQTPVADPSTPPDRDSDQPETVAQEDAIYTINEGDTLTSISAELGMSVDAIAEYNAVRDINVISEGAVLRVPFIYVPPTAPAN